jgi:hypothetical protein
VPSALPPPLRPSRGRGASAAGGCEAAVCRRSDSAWLIRVGPSGPRRWCAACGGGSASTIVNLWQIVLLMHPAAPPGGTKLLCPYNKGAGTTYRY